MATNTYVVIDTITTTSVVNSVTFTAIPQNYTDLVIVGNPQWITYEDYQIQVGNNTIDTGANYSVNQFAGWGNTATGSARYNNLTYLAAGARAVSPNFTYPTSQISHLFNYSNTNIYKTLIGRYGDPTGAEVNMNCSTWRNTAAINTIKIGSGGSGGWEIGATFTLYGIAAQGDTGTKATGGVVTSDATYVYHTFTNSGNFVPSTNLTADYLVVAGGGGGGIYVGGGGGAGGLRTSFTASTLSCTSGTNYAVLVGAGGAGAPDSSTKGRNGSDSVFSTITSTGGGGGGTYSSTGAGSNGGSGGGSAWAASNAAGTGNTPSTSPSQGNNGGLAGTDNVTYRNGGGGGGAGAVGGNASTNSYAAGIGGNGSANSITGTSIIYAGGGGGCTNGSSGAGGAGGTGGGGVGGNNNVAIPAAGNGTMALGAGGGGGGLIAGNGGSGVVIIRYAK